MIIAAITKHTINSPTDRGRGGGGGDGTNFRGPCSGGPIQGHKIGRLESV